MKSALVYAQAQNYDSLNSCSAPARGCKTITEGEVTSQSSNASPTFRAASKRPIRRQQGPRTTEDQSNELRERHLRKQRFPKTRVWDLDRAFDGPHD
ncbi:hypothetical protein MTO96_029921 [Rhipicephalus appendiculatus]